MACLGYSSILGNPNSAILSPSSPKFSSFSLNYHPSLSLRSHQSLTPNNSRIHHNNHRHSRHPNFLVMACTSNSRPLRIMISGAPASGKGTQCELIKEKVPEELLVERVVGRRLDPVTGKIYHLKYSPPENDEIASRLTQRFDDTEEKVKLRLQTHHQNVEAVLSMYEDIIVEVDGSALKQDVFAQIDKAISKLVEQKTASESVAA